MREELSLPPKWLGEKYLQLPVCVSAFPRGSFLLNTWWRWWVAKVKGSCQQFSQAVSLFPLNCRENGPSHLAATSASQFVPNSPCAFTVGSGLPALCVPVVSAFLNAAVLVPLPFPPSPCPSTGRCSQSVGSSTRTVSNCIHPPVWVHLSPPAKGGGTCSSKQKTEKCNLVINTF